MIIHCKEVAESGAQSNLSPINPRDTDILLFLPSEEFLNLPQCSTYHGKQDQAVECQFMTSWEEKGFSTCANRMWLDWKDILANGKRTCWEVFQSSKPIIINSLMQLGVGAEPTLSGM